MLKNIRFFLLMLVAAFILPLSISCVNDRQECLIVGDSIDIRHATLLNIVECDGYSVADIKNPWKEGLLHRYILLPKGEPLPQSLPSGTILRVPLDSIILFSTVHSELICNLGCAATVVGVCEAQYMTQPTIAYGVKKGEILDCGSSLNVDIEKVMQLQPQAVWVLPYENGGYGKLGKLSLPLVECVEYMESSPLGGAEWMRFYGRLMGRAADSDSLFAFVESRYMQLRDSVSRCSSRPTLLCELKSSSAWYVPGGTSTIGQLYSDAGADYLFADYKQSGSVPLAFETILDKAATADFWLLKYGGKEKSYSSLLEEFGGYKHIKAFEQRNIYACALDKKRFYEETPFRPDILLEELAAIFHPELFVNHSLRYYEKLQEK